MNEYIDVRGVYPIYFRGSIFMRLPDWARNFTIPEARDYFMDMNK